MQPRHLLLPLLIVLLLIHGCSSNLYDELPSKMASFVTQYFPGTAIDTYTETSDSYYVRIKHGPGITFDSNYNWTEINGYGMTLPQVILFDQLPTALYRYIQSAEWLDFVFDISRDNNIYMVTLLNSTLRYETATGSIRTIETPPLQ